MMKRKSIVLAISLSLFCAAFASADARIELSLTAGPEWSHVKWFGPMRLVLTPQIAVWLEDASGRYLADLFVTEKAGKSTWGTVRRPESLPVWSHARGKKYADGLYMPTKEDPLPDAISGPTPKAKRMGEEIRLSFALPPSAGPGSRLHVEVNASFDFNAAFPERKGNVNGQPSVVYSMKLGEPGAPEAQAALLGSGHPAGADGRIVPAAAGLDGALRIVADLKARVVR